MCDKYLKAKKVLEDFNQEHLLCFYDELNDLQKEALLNQILSIDFAQILALYEHSKKNDEYVNVDISPIPHVEKNLFSDDEVRFFSDIGDNELKSGHFAVVTMAGGQGSRLGYKGPKGTYPLNLKPKKKSLFQIMCEDLKRANSRYGITIPWYIMTSDENDAKTKSFFVANNYFDYPESAIKFFVQDKLPIISVDGKLLLQEPYLIREAANGNGNVFGSMYRAGILEDMAKKDIRWISFGGIDNVLLKNADAFFLGLAIDGGFQIASKSIFKKGPLENTAVYCLKNGKPGILDYDRIDLQLSESKDSNGLYMYREANMLSHLMSFEAVTKVASCSLPYHRAYKKNSFVNFEGVKVVPDRPNTFKFEGFIFDAFSYFDDMLLLRVDPDEEFAPIKDFTGIYNPDAAIQKFEKVWGSN